MKKRLGITGFGVLLVIALLAGCKLGSPSIPSALPAPTPTPPVIYSLSFQQGSLPAGGYGGNTATWVDASSPSVSHLSDTYLRIATDPSPSNYGRILIKFDVSLVPANTVISGVLLTLKTQVTTSLGSGSYVMGAYDAATTNVVSGGGLWTSSANWNTYNGSTAWGTCGGPSMMTAGYDFQTTAMSSVTLTSAVNGTSAAYAWNLAPSLVQGWVMGTNDGIVLRSAGEFGEGTSAVNFYDETAVSLSDRPLLTVNYYVP